MLLGKEACERRTSHKGKGFPPSHESFPVSPWAPPQVGRIIEGGMPSFADSIFLFVLALLLFGPKRLPVLARELGKWVGEFRRASNEFKMQMEDELRASEQADRQKQIAAMEAAAPVPPPLEEPPHPHLRHNVPPPPSMLGPDAATEPATADALTAAATDIEAPVPTPEPIPQTIDGVRPIPIASAGDPHMMPPATGLPTPRPRNTGPLGGGLLDAIPETTPEPTFAEATPENAAHGD